MTGLSSVMNPTWAWCQKCNKRSSQALYDVGTGASAVCPFCGNTGGFMQKDEHGAPLRNDKGNLMPGAFRETKKVCKHEGCTRGVWKSIGLKDMCSDHAKEENKEHKE